MWAEGGGGGGVCGAALDGADIVQVATGPTITGLAGDADNLPVYWTANGKVLQTEGVVARVSPVTAVVEADWASGTARIGVGSGCGGTLGPGGGWARSWSGHRGSGWACGGMADAGDLKSPVPRGRAGSNPATPSSVGATFWASFQKKALSSASGSKSPMRSGRSTQVGPGGTDARREIPPRPFPDLPQGHYRLAALLVSVI